MDDVIEVVIEVLGDLLEIALGNIKNPKKRKWALTSFYSVLVLGVTALPAFSTVVFGKEGNVTGAIVMGVIAGALLAVGGFFIVLGHRQNWKKH